MSLNAVESRDLTGFGPAILRIFPVFSPSTGHKRDATIPPPLRYFGVRMGVMMAHWSDELRIDPVVWATALFGVLAAAILVTAI